MKTEQHENADKLRKTIDEKSDRLERIKKYLEKLEKGSRINLECSGLNDIMMPVHISKTALILTKEHAETELKELEKEYDAL